MPKKFGKITLASTGDFPRDKDNKIKGWVEHAGGTFAKELSRNVTHLLCSDKAWKRYYPIVKEARRMKSVYIVKLNWLEDSLLSKSGKPLDTAKYQWEQKKVTKCGIKKRKRSDDDEGVEDGNEAKEARSTKRARKRKQTDAEGAAASKDKRIEKAGKEFDEAYVEFEKHMGNHGYRPFTDQSGFVYLLTMVRNDILKNRLEKHRIKVRYAPSFSSQHDTFIPMTHQGVDRRRMKSDDSVSPTERIKYSTYIDAVEYNDLPLDIPILPPCPVPLYYFPKPYPFSQNPCIESSLPRRLTPSNPSLRVRIPDPWAQSLQLFVSDEGPESIPTGDPKYSTPSAFHQSNLQELRKRSYAAYIVYTRGRARHIQTLAPTGSTFDFAWTTFGKFFESRVGVKWNDLHSSWKRGIKFDNFLKGRFGGEDGAADSQHWDVVEPTVAYRPGPAAAEEKTKSDGDEEGRPAVTVVLSSSKVHNDDQIEARAMTPEDGW